MLAMVGPNVEFTVSGVANTYYGHLAAGAGGSQGAFSYLVTPYEAINARARVDGTVIRWILNNTYAAATTDAVSGGAVAGIMLPSGGVDFTQTIPAYAASASVCLAFINADSGEGADRTELRDTVCLHSLFSPSRSHDTMIYDMSEISFSFHLASENKFANTVVVIGTGYSRVYRRSCL